jgi:hypothetical protein
MSLRIDVCRALDAARRLTILYLSKATERSMTENERPLHDEVMSSLGNLWFALMPLPQVSLAPFGPAVTSVVCVSALT